MFNRRNLLQSGVWALTAPAWTIGTKASAAAMPELGSKLALPDVKLLDGHIWMLKSNPPSVLVVY